MRILVNTPDGKKHHGVIKDGDFIRSLDGRYVRWSDRSFCINKDALHQINNTKNCIFKYSMAYEIKTYLIPTEEVLKIRPTCNEKGEYNVRIPIDDCELVTVRKKKGVKKPKKGKRTIHEIARDLNKNKTDQSSLF